MEQAAYLCMAKCNDNITMSSEAVNACMRRCEQPLQGINQVVQQEVGGMQVRGKGGRAGNANHGVIMAVVLFVLGVVSDGVCVFNLRLLRSSLA